MVRGKAEIRAAVEAESDKLRKLVGLASWWDGADKALNADERAAVMAWWDRMSGRSCWNDAFLQWLDSLPA